MADDRGRDAPEPTTGQRVYRDVGGLVTDSSSATPDPIAAEVATHPHAGGTLDLPESDQVTAAGDLDPGQVLGHFVIRARLGEGGMGMVFSGHDADLGRPVAIKVVKDSATHPAHRARLLREAQVMARLEHPNVVRVYEIGSDRGRLFVAMELVDGVTLTTWLKVQRRSWREVIAMFRQVGAGLAAVHRAGLVHRDFKPDNVLVDRDGRARVADFGLARLDPDRATLTPELAASLTRTGMMVGTPAYMAPEQRFGGDVDARADQYSFCISLRGALIGSLPLKLEDAHWGDVPRGVRSAINRGAAIDVTERFASMDELLDALARGASRRRTYMAAAASVVLVGGIVGAIVVNASSSPSVSASQAPVPAGPVADTRVVKTGVANTGVVGSPDGDNTVGGKPPDDKPVVGSSALDVGKSPADTRIAVTPAAHHVAGNPGANDGGIPAADTRVADNPGADARGSGKPAADKRDNPGADEPGTADPRGDEPATAPSTGSTTATTVGTTVVTPMAPVKPTDAAHSAKPAHEMPAAHRAAVRTALRDFGFLGIAITGDDRDADLRELEAKLADTTDDLQRGVLMYGMGHAERAQGNCIAAKKHWSEARKLVLPATKDRSNQQRYDLGSLFYSRLRVGEMWCDLMSGRALGVSANLESALLGMWAAKRTERAEVWFAMGIADNETGNVAEGRQHLRAAAQNTNDEKLRRAIDAYARAVGLDLAAPAP